MVISDAQQLHDKKITAVKRSLETDNGRTVKPEKILEWSLLEIAETLRAVLYLLQEQQVSERLREQRADRREMTKGI